MINKHTVVNAVQSTLDSLSSLLGGVDHPLTNQLFDVSDYTDILEIHSRNGSKTSHVAASRTSKADKYTITKVVVYEGLVVPYLAQQDSVPLDTQTITVAEHEFMHIYLNHFSRAVDLIAIKPEYFTPKYTPYTDHLIALLEHYELVALHALVRSAVDTSYFITLPPDMKDKVNLHAVCKYSKWEDMMKYLWLNHKDLWDAQAKPEESEVPFVQLSGKGGEGDGEVATGVIVNIPDSDQNDTEAPHMADLHKLKGNMKHAEVDKVIRRVITKVTLAASGSKSTRWKVSNKVKHIPYGSIYKPYVEPSGTIYLDVSGSMTGTFNRGSLDSGQQIALNILSKIKGKYTLQTFNSGFKQYFKNLNPKTLAEIKWGGSTEMDILDGILNKQSIVITDAGDHSLEALNQAGLCLIINNPDCGLTGSRIHHIEL